MPNSTNRQTATHKVRINSYKRVARQDVRRKTGHGTQKDGPRIIADSLFALTLAPKPGLEVITNLKSYEFDRNFRQMDVKRMYNDLLAIVHNAIKVQTGQVTKFDPLASGLSIGASTTYILKAFETNVLPTGFDYNIDCNDEGYYFSVYKFCDFNTYWHHFEVKPMLIKLNRYNPRLIPIFNSIIHCLIYKAGFGTWWNGGMGYAEFAIEDVIAHWDDQYDGEEDPESALQVAMDECASYELGEAKQYELMIKKLKYRKPESILRSLNAFSQRSPMVKLFKSICNFLIETGSITDFIYYECDLEGLSFDQQVTVIWDLKDIYSKIQMESIDAEANGCGIYDPVLTYPVNKNYKKMDFELLNQQLGWPMKISKLFQEYEPIASK